MAASSKLRPTAVVVGASRGIGLEIARQLHAQHPGTNQVVGTMRKPDASLLPSDVAVESLDITSAESIKAFADRIESIDTLVINAAVGQADELYDTEPDKLRWYLEANVIGVNEILRALLPALRKGSDKKIIFLSSTSASMQGQIGNKIGLHGPYSVSKAASNMIAIQYFNALHDEHFAVSLIHPGWVATDMGKSAGDGGMPVETSVKGVVEQINNSSFEKSPWFVKFNGESMPW